MRILIIEDESRAANQLQRLLSARGFTYELLGIIDTVEEALHWFTHNTGPNLIFMDIQLADGLSFEIFQKIEVNAPIIFTTAFDQYAIQAFQVNSVDYLLKPIQEEDLDRALLKFEKSNQNTIIAPEVLSQLLHSMQGTVKREGLLVKDGNGYVQIKISDLLYCYSQESITFGVTPNKRYIIDETLDQFFDSVDSNQFYRINRGQLVTKKAIEKIHPYFNHRLILTLSNARDQEFIVSRQKTNAFKAWMNR
ncbi:LytR/AlgR family response regulator transcription factor [Spongiimicrobium salis]|uniref:LytR/AlgR family response regulator transcription factor n=1 Tax=Spongiimicrobium salis TaxID=1667022 RepID=UPI00374DEE62